MLQSLVFLRSDAESGAHYQHEVNFLGKYFCCLLCTSCTLSTLILIATNYFNTKGVANRSAKIINFVQPSGSFLNGCAIWSNFGCGNFSSKNILRLKMSLVPHPQEDTAPCSNPLSISAIRLSVLSHLRVLKEDTTGNRSLLQ